MDRVIQSPGKYVQGADALQRLGDYLKPLADSWLVIADKFVLGFAEDMKRSTDTARRARLRHSHGTVVLGLDDSTRSASGPRTLL